MIFDDFPDKSMAFFISGLFVRPKFQVISPQFSQKYGTKVPPSVGSWRFPIDYYQVLYTND